MILKESIGVDKNHFGRKSTGNVLPKNQVRTDIAMVKIKGGGTDGIAIRKTVHEEKKVLTEIIRLGRCYGRNC